MDAASSPDELWIMALVIIALLAASAFFSGSETALTAASRAKLRAMADAGSRTAQLALQLTRDGERLIGAILLGNNLVNILAASLATSLFTALMGEGGVAIATLVMTALVLIFAEVLPKTYAITDPERVALRVSPAVAIVTRIFAPLVSLVQVMVRGILALFGVRPQPGQRVLSVREEIAGALALGHSAGVVPKEHRDRLLGALDLSERTVEEVMRHRSQIEMIDADAPPEAVVEQVVASIHTRLPLYRDEPENVVGVLHAKDLLRELHRLGREHGTLAEAVRHLDVMAIARPPYFIPETTTLDAQMREFLRRHTHFALVVDEYGALRGLITLEDILEEIVGEIRDEFDSTAESGIHRQEDGSFVVDGATTIRDLNRALDWSLPDEHANTIAGLLIHESRSIPSEGQVFCFHGVRFEVLERQRNRITRLRLRPADGAC